VVRIEADGGTVCGTVDDDQGRIEIETSTGKTQERNLAGIYTGSMR
jgi:hypothetical protein